MSSKFPPSSEDTRIICSASQALAFIWRACMKSWPLAWRFSEVLVSWIKLACLFFTLPLMTAIYLKLIIDTVYLEYGESVITSGFRPCKHRVLLRGFVLPLSVLFLEAFITSNCQEEASAAPAFPSSSSPLSPLLSLFSFLCLSFLFLVTSLSSAWYLRDFDWKFNSNRCVELGGKIYLLMQKFPSL